MEFVEELDIHRLKPYARNARKHSTDQVREIADSIKAFGFVTPIIIDEDYRILAGHGRLEAAKKSGMTHVPAFIYDKLETEAQKAAFTIADNRIAEKSKWDMELLRSEFEMLTGEGFAVDVTGFSELDLQEILNTKEEDRAGDIDSVPRLIPHSRVKRGDIWKCGRHFLMCGDSTNQADVARLLNGIKADMVLTDPPYNCNLGLRSAKSGNGGERNSSIRAYHSIENDNMSQSSFLQFLNEVWGNIAFSLKAGGAFYVFYGDNATFDFHYTLHKNKDLKFHQLLHWIKNHFAISRLDYQTKTEACIAGERLEDEEEAAIYGWKEGDKREWRNNRKQTNLLYYNKPLVSKDHPTMKPVEMFEYLIKNNTKQKQIVLDLFGGSGTTMIASEISNRTAYLMELSEHYCEVILQRYQDFTGDEVVKL